jgi:hypothetical protein
MLTPGLAGARSAPIPHPAAPAGHAGAVIECDYCSHGYDPVATRWRCPSCGYKSHCCEGAACSPEPFVALAAPGLAETARPPVIR